MDSQEKKTMWAIIAAIIGTLIIAWLFFGTNNNEESSDHNGPGRIGGELTFDALTPEEGDKGEIVFEIRKHNSGDVFAPAHMAIAPSFTNGGTWMIDNLEEGTTYDIQATLIIDSKKITQSQIATATAPADNINLTLTVTWNDLPQQSIKQSQNKNIAGTLTINGYIPDGATYAIFAAPARDESQLQPEEVVNPQFTKVITGALAKEKNTWEWNGALAQVRYLIRAELYTADGDYIGTSDIVDAIVPQNNVALSLQSQASTEPTQTPLSGTVTINGSYKSDSYVSVQVRENSTGGFMEVDHFPAESSRNWVYSGAKSGMNYDVRAILERNGEEQSKSNQKHVIAPAGDITLTINTDMHLSDPEQRPEIVKCDEKDDNKYDATIRFPSIADARSYWIKIGTEKYGADRFNEPEKPDNTGDSVDVKIRIDEDRYYYAEYAYSYCKDCTTLDSYSDFSPSLKFYCGEQPEDD